MRFYILRALVMKEVHRHLANRGGIALAFLLIVAALLLSVFNPTGSGGSSSNDSGLVDGVHHCYIVFDNEEIEGKKIKPPLITTLEDSVPADLKKQVIFEPHDPNKVDGLQKRTPGTVEIRLEKRTAKVNDKDKQILKCRVWYPPGKEGAMAKYELWFWKSLRVALQRQASADFRAAGVDPSPLTAPDSGTDDQWAIRDSFRQLDIQVERLNMDVPKTKAKPSVPEVEIERDALGAEVLDLRSAIATGMVVFALYFTCCYLLPTLNCEERERGVLLAQALSPASPAEILTAKFLFYPMLGMGLAATLAGIYHPAVLSTLFFWLALLAISAGFLGIGMTVATIAKTQRAAFMGSMCYLLSVALIMFICQLSGIPGIPYLAIEYHGPRILHAAITGNVDTVHWLHLAATAFLAAIWIFVAGWLFRRRGWQ